ncbi:MAG: hypothetical protein ABH954_03825 [Candidatus Omnitrophota bacterium]
MFKLMGLFAIIPATIILTISFFVLLALRSVDSPGLKAFGKVITVLLCIAAALILLCGIYTISSGYCPMMKMMKCGSMKGQMMHGPMMER